jgi:mono/diheme cytochrome c family protein
MMLAAVAALAVIGAAQDAAFGQAGEGAPGDRAQDAPSGTREAPSVARIQRGVQLARTHCAKCHSIDKRSPSPVAIAPALRDLHKRYPVDQLEEPLAEGLMTGHPSMPEFRFEPDQIDDFIAFLKSLEPS